MHGSIVCIKRVMTLNSIDYHKPFPLLCFLVSAIILSKSIGEGSYDITSAARFELYSKFLHILLDTFSQSSNRGYFASISLDFQCVIFHVELYWAKSVL